MTKSGIKVKCLYYGSKLENMVSAIQVLNYGDKLLITDEGKYVFGIGWFIQIIVNEEEKNFVLVKELEEAIMSQNLQSIIDLLLEYTILSFQLDRALEFRQEELFLSILKKYQDMMELIGGYRKLSS